MGDNKKDLTRIEDLSEFIHQNSSELDDQLETFSKDSPDGNSASSEEQDLALEQSIQESNDFPPEFQVSPPDENLAEAQDLGDDSPPDFDPDGQTDPNLDISSLNSDSSLPSETEEDLGQDVEPVSEDLSSLPDLPQNEDAPQAEDTLSFNDNLGENSLEADPFATTTESENALDSDSTALGEESTELSSLESDESSSHLDSNDTFSDLEPPSSTPAAEQQGPELKVKKEIPSAPEEIVQKIKTSQTTQTREKFQDVRDFAETLSYGSVAGPGNPPYSIVLKNIKYKEDVEDILIDLKNHGLCGPENEESFRKSLSLGSLLISQLSEYSAIFLAHKFRKYNLTLSMGLSEEIHPPKSYSDPKRGLVSKSNLSQNKKESKDLQHKDYQVETIELSTTPLLEGRTIKKYLGIVSEHMLVDEEMFLAQEHGDLEKQLSPQSLTSDHEQIDSTVKALTLLEQQWQESTKEKTKEVEPLSLGVVYTSLVERLKGKAQELKGNAVVGINFQIVPLILENNENGRAKYKVTCVGSVVWAQ